MARRARKFFSRTALWGLLVAELALPASGFAQVDDAMYRDLMSIAQKRVRERQLRRVPGARLGLGAIQALKLSERFYKPGDAWAVRFTPTSDPAVAAMARMESVADVKPVERESSTYDFKVIGLPDANLARVSVTQRLAPGENRMDPKIDHVVLTMNRRFIPVKKEIYYRNGRPPLAIALDERGPMAMGMEAAPVDMPNLGNDDGTPLVDPATGKPGVRFETEDIYGRSVSATWLEGELWPSVVDTTAGTARVVR